MVTERILHARHSFILENLKVKKDTVLAVTAYNSVIIEFEFPIREMQILI